MDNIINYIQHILYIIYNNIYNKTILLLIVL